MVRSLMRTVLAVTLVASLVACSGCTKSRQSNQATLTVISETTGLSVFLDEKPIGETPLRAVPLASGDHRLRIAANTPFETTVSAGKDGLPVVVLHTENCPGPDVDPIVISADKTEVIISAFGETLGAAPFTLIPATARRTVLTAECPGRLPVLAEVGPFGLSDRELKLRLTEKPNGTPGTLALSGIRVLPVAWQETSASFVIGPASSPINDFWVSPDGQRVALYTGVEALSVYTQVDGGWSGQPLFAWKTAPIAIQQQSDRQTPVMSAWPLVLGWRDATHLVVTAGELDPAGQEPGEGLGIWVLDATGTPPARAAWISPRHLGDAAGMPRLTGDGKAVVLQHQHPLVSTTSFAIADLDTGAMHEVSADIPHSEHATGSIFWPSPDSWSVAYQRPFQGGAVESDIFVFDLRTGTERKVFGCVKGGLAADIIWAPDSRKLALGYAAPGEKYALLPGEDYDTFLPPAYAVVTDTGQRLATFAAPGKQLAPNPQWSADSSRFAVAEALGVVPEDMSGYGQMIPGDVLVFDMNARYIEVSTGVTGAPGEIMLEFAETGELILDVRRGDQYSASVVSTDASNRVDYMNCLPLHAGLEYNRPGHSLTPFGLLTVLGQGRIELRRGAGDALSLLPDGLSCRYPSRISGSLLFVSATKTVDPYCLVIIDLSTFGAEHLWPK